MNGRVINNSGIANYILVNDINQNLALQFLINNLTEIREYAQRHDIFFACKALNYRIQKDKWDGDRPLAVYVDWLLENGKLKHEIIFDNPLSKRGNEIGNTIRRILGLLNITEHNFNSIEDIVNDKNICYKK